MKKLYSALVSALVCLFCSLTAHADIAPLPPEPEQTSSVSVPVIILVCAVVILAAVLLIRALRKRK